MRTSFQMKFRYFLIFWIPLLLFMGMVLWNLPEIDKEKNPKTAATRNRPLEMAAFIVLSFIWTLMIYIGGWKPQKTKS